MDSKLSRLLGADKNPGGNSVKKGECDAHLPSSIREV